MGYVMGCDENPITDWGFDTEALVATVREALNDLGCNPDNSVYAALDTLASELERLRTVAAAREVLATKGNEWRHRAEAAEAELERVRAERDDYKESYWGLRDADRQSQARLDRAVGALQEIAGLTHFAIANGVGHGPAIARAALAEIEESA